MLLCEYEPNFPEVGLEGGVQSRAFGELRVHLSFRPL